MARPVTENPSQQGIAKASTSTCIIPPEQQCPVRKWYFTKQEIEDSPSRRDGIASKKETYLRTLYCQFLQEIGMKLKVPQLTIASAMMLCHQFYMRQSHAKNGWQTVATASIFLACKVEDTPRFLNDVVVVAYEMVYKLDETAMRNIRQKEFLSKQKELILVAERVLLSTIGFDLDIQLPYKILVAALKKLDLLPELAKAAWNFVNDWLRTSLCLQYKPHYIAAGSLALAANIQKVKLPKEKGKVWWQEFDVTPKQLDEVIQRMHSMFKPLPAKTGKLVQSETSFKKPNDSSPQSCISSEAIVDQHSKHGPVVDDRGLGESAVSNKGNLGGENHVIMKDALPCQASDSCIVDDSGSEIKPMRLLDLQNSRCKIIGVPHSCGKIDGGTDVKPIKQEPDDQNSRKKIVDVPNKYCKIDSGADIKPIKRQLEDHNSRCKVVDVPNSCVKIESGAEIKPKRMELDDQRSSCKIDDVPNSCVKIDSGAETKPIRKELDDHRSTCKIDDVPISCCKINIDRIRELKRKRCNKGVNKKVAGSIVDELDTEAWIVSELERGVELENAFATKKQRKAQ